MNSILPHKIDTLFNNCSIATMQNGALSEIHNGALCVTGQKISWLGPSACLSEQDREKAAKTIDCRQKWLLPGFVDCHTHLVWAGSRSSEFEMRLNGITYEEISDKGGGIFSTVRSVREASVDTLFDLASKRVETLLKEGVTTVEIKSGYGLDTDSELKMLAVIKQLGERLPVHVEATFLGAHALPPEFKSRSKEYIQFITQTLLPEVKKQGIASAVDAFCEKIAFSRDEAGLVLEKAKELGFNIKLHAEQLSDSGGAAMAAELGALSCDHLEYLSRSGARKMAENNSAAVLLPGAFYYLKETQKPPMDIFRELGIPMAVSTDLNPGSSPVHSILTAMNMACLMFGMTCEEALLGATIKGARALGLDKAKGSLEIGKDADLVLWDIAGPADLCYPIGPAPADLIMTSGIICFSKDTAD